MSSRNKRIIEFFELHEAFSAHDEPPRGQQRSAAVVAEDPVVPQRKTRSRTPYSASVELSLPYEWQGRVGRPRPGEGPWYILSFALHRLLKPLAAGQDIDAESLLRLVHDECAPLSRFFEAQWVESHERPGCFSRIELVCVPTTPTEWPLQWRLIGYPPHFDAHWRKRVDQNKHTLVAGSKPWPQAMAQHFAGPANLVLLQECHHTAYNLRQLAYLARRALQTGDRLGDSWQARDHAAVLLDLPPNATRP